MSLLPDRYSDKQKTSRQIVAFVTRIKPINNLIWNILNGNFHQKGKKKKKQVEGVSTFCHLQGLNDQDTLNVLEQVFKGTITADEMRLKIQRLKQEERCFKQSISYIQNRLAINNVCHPFHL